MATALKYLGLPADYEPSPEKEPIGFITKHLQQLPPHILSQFSSIVNAKDRTKITAIRNRRYKYANTRPSELSFTAAKNNWPLMWEGRERRGKEEGEEEKTWAETGFLQGSKQHVGKLGNLLGEYEEEREAERVRVLRRQVFVLEEEFDSDSDDEEQVQQVEESPEENKNWFERMIKEKFIYGLLDDFDYDSVDWNEGLDDEQDDEERWFDDEEEFT